MKASSESGLCATVISRTCPDGLLPGTLLFQKLLSSLNSRNLLRTVSLSLDNLLTASPCDRASDWQCRAATITLITSAARNQYKPEISSLGQRMREE